MGENRRRFRILTAFNFFLYQDYSGADLRLLYDVDPRDNNPADSPTPLQMVTFDTCSIPWADFGWRRSEVEDLFLEIV